MLNVFKNYNKFLIRILPIIKFFEGILNTKNTKNYKILINTLETIKKMKRYFGFGFFFY